MKILYFLLFVGLGFTACDKDDENLSCFSFDIRQCQTDLFADDVPESDSQRDREDKMKEWLESKGYDVKKVKLHLNYHDAVCEACHVCPQGDRYFVQKNNSEAEESPETLQLLSYEEISCDDAF